MSKTLAAFPFGLALLVSAPGCAPPVPAAPTYATDVKPIFMARCTRCHDETRRGETLPTPSGAPAWCHLNRYESTGNCATPIDLAMCSGGAGLCGTQLVVNMALQAIASPDNKFNPPMPPDPAPKLTSWEQDVLGAWLKNLDASGMPAP